MRSVIFANGILSNPKHIKEIIVPDDLIIAADGGTHHCLKLGISPNVVVGDIDSLDSLCLHFLRELGTEIISYPVNKDHYIVFRDTSSDDMYLVIGPEKDDDHWLAELPKVRPEIVITELSKDDIDTSDDK